MADYQSYQVRSTSPADGPEKSAAEQRIQHDQARQPGRIRYDAATDQVTYDDVQQASTHTNAATKSADPFNFAEDSSGNRVDYFDTKLSDDQVFIYIGGDKTTKRAAMLAGLLKRDGAGKWYVATGFSSPDPRSAAEGQEQGNQAQQQQTPAADVVPSLPGDASLGQIAQAVGDAKVYSLIEGAALGHEMSDLTARDIAQVSGGEPEAIRAQWQAHMVEYGEVGNAALEAAGIPSDRIDEAMVWMRTNRKGDLVEAITDLVRQASRSTSKLKALGREYVKATGNAFSDDELETFDLPEGARWHRGSKGELLVTIKGWGTSSAQSALRQGVLSF